MEPGGLERMCDVRNHVSTGEERLRISGRDDVQLAVVVEVADCVQRSPCGGRSERERIFELIPLGLRRSASRQQPVRMLPRDTVLRGQIRDRQPFAAQKRLPNLGFIPQGDDRNPYP
jgi:hypothetical protein